MASLFIVSCQKWDDYKKYNNEGEKVYPGAVTKVVASPGNERIQLSWIHGIDSRISKYVVLWNNGNDSIVLDASAINAGDTVAPVIEGLSEGTYAFLVYSVDENNNLSVPFELSTARVYGSLYENGILNRSYRSIDYDADNGSLLIHWNTADTFNIGTKLRYTDVTGNEQTITVDSGSYETNIPWELGSVIYYRSAYKPVITAIDSFTVVNEDSIIVSNIPVPKTNWSKVDLPGDIGGNEYGANFTSIWDGSAGSFPDVYHSGSEGIPHTFTIDLGASYALTMFEEIGRQGCDCNNPVRFELWATNDITDAATALSPGDDGWEQESIDKGWTLLNAIERNDNGMAALKVNIPENTPPMRYIRVRVLETNNGNTESNMSEISFWYNP